MHGGEHGDRAHTEASLRQWKTEMGGACAQLRSGFGKEVSQESLIKGGGARRTTAMSGIAHVLPETNMG